MNRLESLFQKKDKNICNIYFTAGYPNLNDTTKIILALEKAGADLVEIGMPYSDPLADGPTIQQSGTVALRNGMNLILLFEQIQKIRSKTQLPLILMGYFNQVMQYGEEAFFKKCKEVGVDGIILPDLPPEIYESDFQELLHELNLNKIFLITPQTSEKRIRYLDELSSGFIYLVSDSSTTGKHKDNSHSATEQDSTQIAYFERIQNMNLKNPRLIGFGISDHKGFVTACKYSNGGIIGSAFIRALENANNLEETIVDFLDKIKNGNSVLSNP